MINFKKDGLVFALPIEKHPVAAGDAERESMREEHYFLYVQSGIAPIGFKSSFLNTIKSLNVVRQCSKSALKILSADYFHTETGGYRLMAF